MRYVDAIFGGKKVRCNCHPWLQLIDALYSMTTSVNCRNTRSLSREDWFNGDLVRYRRYLFIRQFESYMKLSVQNPADKLDILISLCTGEADKHIADYTMAASPELNYFKAQNILQTNYGQSHIVVGTYVRTLTEGPSLHANDSVSLTKIARDREKLSDYLSWVC